MEITFATEELKEACLARVPKADDLPGDVIGVLHTYYNTMRNADHIEELPLGKPEKGELSTNSTWRVDLGNGYGVIMRIDQKNVPQNESGIDLAGIYRVQVMAIEVPNA
jgi:hypothetical protein